MGEWPEATALAKESLLLDGKSGRMHRFRQFPSSSPNAATSRGAAMAAPVESYAKISTSPASVRKLDLTCLLHAIVIGLHATSHLRLVLFIDGSSEFRVRARYELFKALENRHNGVSFESFCRNTLRTRTVHSGFESLRSKDGQRVSIGSGCID